LQLVSSSSYFSTTVSSAFLDGFGGLLLFLKVSTSCLLLQLVSSSYLSTTLLVLSLMVLGLFYFSSKLLHLASSRNLSPLCTY
jgi:hypothetical protein